MLSLAFIASSFRDTDENLLFRTDLSGPLLFLQLLKEYTHKDYLSIHKKMVGETNIFMKIGGAVSWI